MVKKGLLDFVRNPQMGGGVASGAADPRRLQAGRVHPFYELLERRAGQKDAGTWKADWAHPSAV